MWVVCFLVEGTNVLYLTHKLNVYTQRVSDIFALAFGHRKFPHYSYFICELLKLFKTIQFGLSVFICVHRLVCVFLSPFFPSTSLTFCRTPYLPSQKAFFLVVLGSSTFDILPTVCMCEFERNCELSAHLNHSHTVLIPMNHLSISHWFCCFRCVHLQFHKITKWQLFKAKCVYTFDMGVESNSIAFVLFVHLHSLITNGVCVFFV